MRKPVVERKPVRKAVAFAGDDVWVSNCTDPSEAVDAFLASRPADVWDVPAEAFGMLAPGRHSDGWVFVPLHRHGRHFADVLIGLDMAGWDGLAFLTESWTWAESNTDAAGSAASDVSPPSEVRLVFWHLCAEEARPHLASLARGGRDVSYPIPTTGVAGWVSSLVAAAAAGPLPFLMPAASAELRVWDAVLGGPEKFGWAYQGDVAAGVQWLSDPDALLASAAQWYQENGRQLLSWDDAIESMPGKTLELTEESVNWFGGLLRVLAEAFRRADPDSAREHMVFIALLGEQVWQPSSEAGHAFDSSLRGLALLHPDMPTGERLDQVEKAMRDDWIADEAVADDFIRWGSGHPDAQVRRIVVGGQLEGGLEGARAYLTEHLGVPDGLAKRITNAFSALVDESRSRAQDPPTLLGRTVAEAAAQLPF